jgi:hypothetical protein
MHYARWRATLIKENKMEEQEIISEVVTDNTVEVKFNAKLMDGIMQYVEENFPEVTIVDVVGNFKMFNKIVEDKYELVIGE